MPKTITLADGLRAKLQEPGAKDALLANGELLAKLRKDSECRKLLDAFESETTDPKAELLAELNGLAESTPTTTPAVEPRYRVLHCPQGTGNIVHGKMKRGSHTIAVESFHPHTGDVFDRVALGRVQALVISHALAHDDQREHLARLAGAEPGRA
jgi:hypothetical protein